jgi:hypothetical protein
MNKYKSYSQDQLEEHFSNYLLDSWSFSKISTFARNEKHFEMSYIYRQPFRSSASSVAGSAYHAAMEVFFTDLKEGIQNDLAALQIIAYAYINDVHPNKWKLQKTTPSIAECIEKATKGVNALLKNFFSDYSIFESEIKEILDVELYCDEFITVNGVDIPLPCHMKIDLIVKTNDGKIVIIDHKSKASFTDEKDLKFSIGKQAITYVIGYETKTDLTVDEVWFIENKTSENRDKSPQLSCFKIQVDHDTRRLYEAMLYEPLKRMLEAISNPDYVYLINENDNFVDKAEIYEFWAMTMIAEVDDFPVQYSKKDLIGKRLKKIRDASLASINPKTLKNFRKGAAEFIQYDLTNKDMNNSEKIEHTLRTLGVVANVAHKFEGYSSDTFLLNVSAGTKLDSVHRYKLDIASALNVSSIRMMKDLYVHEGKSYLAVESGKSRTRDLLFDPTFLQGGKIPLGKDNFDQIVFWDTQNPSTPHVLICGATGSGKSVSIISTIEYAKLAGFTEIVILDPKYEFTSYKGSGISVHNDIEEIENKMEDLVKEMNLLTKQNKKTKTLIIFDEFADAVGQAKAGVELNVKEMIQTGTTKGKGVFGETVFHPKMELKTTGTKNSLEENLKALLQKGRSIGYRIIAATQRASVKVITGDAKANFPVQICFRVPKEVDSKVVLDEAGAEGLQGKGDGLIKSPDYLGTVRFQAFYKPN